MSDTPCSVEGCLDFKHPKAGYGMCHMHYWRRYRSENRDRLDASYKEWKKKRGSRWEKMAEPERTALRSHNARRRALRRGATAYQVTDRDLRRILALYRSSCAYCETPLSVPHWDHVVPLALGGTHSVGNLLPSCEDCNKSKGSATLMEWRVARKRKRPVPRHRYHKELSADV